MVGQNQTENKVLAAELVCKTISTLNEEKGSTLRTIRDHISNEYKIPPDVIKNLIIPSLENGIQFGVIVQNMGRYHLSNLLEKILDLARKRKNKKPIYEPCYSDDDRRCQNCQNQNKDQKKRRKNKSDKKEERFGRQYTTDCLRGVQRQDNPCGGTSESEKEECTIYGLCQDECCQSCHSQS